MSLLHVTPAGDRVQGAFHQGLGQLIDPAGPWGNRERAHQAQGRIIAEHGLVHALESRSIDDVRPVGHLTKALRGLVPPVLRGVIEDQGRTGGRGLVPGPVLARLVALA